MHSSGRGGAKVRVLAVHTTEGIMRAADLRAWTSWAGSSHASADETGVLLAGAADGFVDYSLASWTLRSGNPWSENIELCGFAKWSRADWLARPKLLDACARWLAARSQARGIPLVKLTPQQYRAGQSGVIGHHDHTVGYSDGTHWDPGPGFPYDLVLEQARAYVSGKPQPFPSPALPTLLGESDMRFLRTPDGTIWKATDLYVRPEGRLEKANALAKGNGVTKWTEVTREEMLEAKADADELRGLLLSEIARAAGGDIDEAAIVAGLLPKLTEALSNLPGSALTRDDVEQAVRGVFADAGS